MNGDPYEGAKTVCLPPIGTLRSGLRACWTNSRGALACTMLRHMPGGQRTRSPSTSAPAAFQICQRLGVVAVVDADLRQDGVGVALDEREPLFVEHLVDSRSCA